MIELISKARHLLSKIRRALRGDRLISKKSLFIGSNIVIGSGSEIRDYVVIQSLTGTVVIGNNTQINHFTVIYGGNVYIGDNVMIAPHVMIASGNHDYVQTERPMRFAGILTRGPIRIEDNVWIGANSTITDGVIVGREAVVGANSVVTKDVKPYDIVAGNPARPIGNRLTSTRKKNSEMIRHMSIEPILESETAGNL